MNVNSEKIETITGCRFSAIHKKTAEQLLESGKFVTFFGASVSQKERCKFEKSAEKFLRERYADRLAAAYPNNGYMSAVFALKEEN